MLYALLVSEFGERKPQLTARIGHTLMKDRRVLSAYGLNLPVRPASIFIGSALALSFSYQAAPHIPDGKDRFAPYRGLVRRNAGELLALLHAEDFSLQLSALT